MSGATNGAHSLVEVHEALNGFTDEDWERFRQVAKYQLLRLPQLDPRELVNETVMRFLDERRSWPKGPPFRAVFYNALRSVADEMRGDEMEKPVMTAADLEPDKDGEPASLDELAADPRTPEKALEAGQLIDRAFADFKGDQDVEAVLYGRMEGQTAEEVQDTFAINANDYHAARKRLERWLRQQMAKGDGL